MGTLKTIFFWCLHFIFHLSSPPPMQLHHLLFYDHSLTLQCLLEVHSAQYPFMQPSRSAGQSSSLSHPAGTPEKKIIFVVLTRTAFFKELMVPSDPPPSIGTAVSSPSRAFHAKSFFRLRILEKLIVSICFLPKPTNSWSSYTNRVQPRSSSPPKLPGGRPRTVLLGRGDGTTN